MLSRQFLDGLLLFLVHLLSKQVNLALISLVKAVHLCLMVLFQILRVLSVLLPHVGDGSLVLGLHLLLLLHHLVALLGVGGSHFFDLFLKLGNLLTQFVLDEFFVAGGSFAKFVEHGLVLGLLGFDLFAGFVVQVSLHLLVIFSRFCFESIKFLLKPLQLLS